MDLRYIGRGVRALARNVHHKTFIKSVLDAALVADFVLPQATTVPFLVAYPEAQRFRVPLGDVTYRTFNMDPMEQYCVTAIAAIRRPKRIFEFGTYDGATTLLLARAAPEAEIFTVDLPPSKFGSPESSLPLQLRAEPAVSGDPWRVVGSCFRGTPEEGRITQLLCDSRTFDPGPFLGTVDMVVVDGGHDEDCVSADTANAFQMVSPQGVVVWDDYSPLWAHVVRTVDDLSARLGRPVIRVANTELAIHDPAVEDSATTPYWSRTSTPEQDTGAA
jgi:hypothetical protein